MRKGLRLATALGAALALANCAQVSRGLKVGLGILETNHHLIGHVCEAAEDVFDNQGVFWGVRFIAAALGQPCSTGGREINVSAALEGELRKARQLEIGQRVEVDGDLAQRDLSQVRQPSGPREESEEASDFPRSLNEPIYARVIRTRK